MDQIDEAVIAQGSALDDILYEWGLGRLELDTVEAGERDVLFHLGSARLIINYDECDFRIERMAGTDLSHFNRLVTVAYRMGFLVDWEDGLFTDHDGTWPLYFTGYHLHENTEKREALFRRRMAAGLNWTKYVDIA